MSVVTRITCTAHMTYASRAYILSALQQRTEESIIHQSTTHTYRNAVIFVPVVKACIPTLSFKLRKVLEDKVIYYYMHTEIKL